MDILTLLIQSVLLAVGLAMDAFAVSISDGLTMKKIIFRQAAAIAGAFGIFRPLDSFCSAAFYRRKNDI